MTSKKMFYLLLGLFVVSLGIGGAGGYFGNQLLTEKSNELIKLKLEDEFLVEQQLALAQGRRDVEEFKSIDGLARAIVPQDKDQAGTIREITLIAEESGVSIAGFSFPASSLGEKSAKSNSKSAPISQLAPVEGMKDVYEMTIGIRNSSPVSYDRLLTFLKNLENNRRTAQVASINITPNTSDRTMVDFNLDIRVYIRP